MSCNRWVRAHSSNEGDQLNGGDIRRMEVFLPLKECFDNQGSLLPFPFNSKLQTDFQVFSLPNYIEKGTLTKFISSSYFTPNHRISSFIFACFVYTRKIAIFVLDEHTRIFFFAFRRSENFPIFSSFFFSAVWGKILTMSFFLFFTALIFFNFIVATACFTQQKLFMNWTRVFWVERKNVWSSWKWTFCVFGFSFFYIRIV